MLIQSNRILKRIIFLFIFFIPLLSPAQTDSTYIGFFDQELSIRPYVYDKFTALSHEIGDHDDEITYRPNNPFGIGIGLTWKNISLSGGYGFDFMRNKKKGKTRSLDFQYHYYGRKFVMDFFFSNYKGFFTEDGKKEGVYELYPNLKLRQYGMFGQYIFNGRKFSYKAAYSQNEKQLKSVGSFLLGGGIYYNYFSSDSILAEGIPNYLNNYQIGVSAGYAYTWVIKKRYYLSGSMSVGVNFGTESLSKIHKVEIYPSLFPRFSAGYNADTWSIALSGVNNRIYVHFKDQSKLSFDTGSLQISFVKRFSIVPKFMRNIDWQPPSFYPSGL